MKEFFSENMGGTVKQQQQQEKPSNDAFSRSSFSIFMQTKIYFFIYFFTNFRFIAFKGVIF